MSFSDILNLFNQGKGTAKSHMKNLIEMAAVDGNFEAIEFNLLKTIAKQTPEETMKRVQLLIG
jgi:hypothetical protein